MAIRRASPGGLLNSRNFKSASWPFRTREFDLQFYESILSLSGRQGESAMGYMESAMVYSRFTPKVLPAAEARKSGSKCTSSRDKCKSARLSALRFRGQVLGVHT